MSIGTGEAPQQPPKGPSRWLALIQAVAPAAHDPLRRCRPDSAATPAGERDVSLGVGYGGTSGDVSHGAGAGAAHHDGSGARLSRDQQVTGVHACLDQL